MALTSLFKEVAIKLPCNRHQLIPYGVLHALGLLSFLQIEYANVTCPPTTTDCRSGTRWSLSKTTIDKSFRLSVGQHIGNRRRLPQQRPAKTGSVDHLGHIGPSQPVSGPSLHCKPFRHGNLQVRHGYPSHKPSDTGPANRIVLAPLDRTARVCTVPVPPI